MAHKLVNLEVEQVDLVGRPANRRKLVWKSADGEPETELDDATLDALLKETEEVAKAGNVGEWFESRIHRQFTDEADDMFGVGYLTRDERIALSGAIGKALDSFRYQLQSKARGLYSRAPFEVPPEQEHAEDHPSPTPEPAATTEPSPVVASGDGEPEGAPENAIASATVDDTGEQAKAEGPAATEDQSVNKQESEEIMDEELKAALAKQAEDMRKQADELAALKKEADARKAAEEAAKAELKKAQDAVAELRKASRLAELAPQCEKAGLDVEKVYKAESVDPEGTAYLLEAIKNVTAQRDELLGKEQGTHRHNPNPGGKTVEDLVKEEMAANPSLSFVDALAVVGTKRANEAQALVKAAQEAAPKG